MRIRKFQNIAFAVGFLFILAVQDSFAAADICMSKPGICEGSIKNGLVEMKACYPQFSTPCGGDYASNEPYVPGCCELIPKAIYSPNPIPEQPAASPKNPKGANSFEDAATAARKAEEQSKAAAEAARRNAELNRAEAAREKKFLDDISSQREAIRGRADQAAAISAEKKNEYLSSDFKGKSEFQNYYEKLGVKKNGDLIGEKGNKVVKNLENSGKVRDGYVKGYEREAIQAERASKKFAELEAANSYSEKKQNSLQSNSFQTDPKKSGERILNEVQKKEQAKGGQNGEGNLKQMQKTGGLSGGIPKKTGKIVDDQKVEISSSEVEKTKLELLKKILGNDEAESKKSNSQIAASNAPEASVEPAKDVKKTSILEEKKEVDATAAAQKSAAAQFGAEEMTIFVRVSSRIRLSVAVWGN